MEVNKILHQLDYLSDFFTSHQGLLLPNRLLKIYHVRVEFIQNLNRPIVGVITVNSSLLLILLIAILDERAILCRKVIVEWELATG